MPAFAYRAIASCGRLVRGVEDVASPLVLDRLLCERRLYPLEITPVGSSSGDRPKRSRWGSRQGDLTESVATLAVLLDAGMTLDAALELTARGTVRSDLGAALTQARQRILEGTRLAQALTAWPHLFPPIAIGLIRAGEEGGRLADTTQRLAEHLERQRTFRARMLSALLYPTLLLITGAAALVVLFLVILPRFVILLQDSGAELPRSTALLLGTADYLRGNVTLIAAVALCAAIITAIGIRGTGGRQRLNSLILRIPVVRGLRIESGSARLARTLATLLASGMSLLPALRVAAEAVGDPVVADWVRAAGQRVQRGEPLSAALACYPFPGVFVRLVQVGEQGGRLEPLLERSSAILESALERRLQRLVTILEPALILLFGIGVGFVALSLLQAIYGIHADGL